MKRQTTLLTGAMVIGTLGGLLTAAPVLAAPDFAVVDLKLASRAALQGKCNKVFVTVQNLSTSDATNPSKGKLITHPANQFNQQRAEKGLFVPALRPGQKRTLTLSNVEIIPMGNVRMTAAFLTGDPSDKQNNDNRSINLQVSRSCNTGGTREPTGAGCDLALQFTAPGNTIPANSPTEFKVKVSNVGSDKCPKRAVRLYQYSGSSASGYGTAVGGTSGSIRQIPELGANENLDLVWSANPGAPGTFTYATKFTGAHNDANNGNHSPKKTVNANN